MHPALLPMLTFLAVVLAVGGVGSLLSDLFVRERKRVTERIDEEFNRKTRDRAKKSTLLLKDVDMTDGIRPDAPTWQARLQTLLEQSGVEMTLERLLVLSASGAVGLALIGFLLRRSIVMGVLGALIGGYIPLLFVQIKRGARQEALRSQLSDAFDLMARALRAGQTMAQGMQGVSDEFPSPIAEEFLLCYEQQNLGMSIDTSLRDLARRTGLMELNIFVVAVLVQRQVGGNLSEILEKLAIVVRERYRMRGQIAALTAEGRMQAMVLMGMPPLLFLAMYIINRPYATVLLQKPTLLWGILFFQGLGGLWIRKIVNFDF